MTKNEIPGTPASARMQGVADYIIADIAEMTFGVELLARTISNTPTNERSIRGLPA